MSGGKLYFVVNGLNYQKNLAAKLLIGWMQRLVLPDFSSVAP